MTRTAWAVIGGALLAVTACGPMDEGSGSGGPPCRNVSDCSSNGCCGGGNAAVSISDQPMCPSVCPTGRDPHSLCVRGDSAIVTCDSSSECVVAPGLPGSCTN